MEVSHHPEIKRLVRIPLAGLTSYITDGPGSGRPVLQAVNAGIAAEFGPNV